MKRASAKLCRAAALSAVTLGATDIAAAQNADDDDRAYFDAELEGGHADDGAPDLSRYGCLPEVSRRETIAQHRKAAQAELERLAC